MFFLQKLFYNFRHTIWKCSLSNQWISGQFITSTPLNSSSIEVAWISRLWVSVCFLIFSIHQTFWPSYRGRPDIGPIRGTAAEESWIPRIPDVVLPSAFKRGHQHVLHHDDLYHHYCVNSVSVCLCSAASARDFLELRKLVAKFHPFHATLLEFLPLKLESRIFGHSFGPVCGFSMMEQVRLCAVWPMGIWLDSSLNQIQGWTTIRQTYSRGLVQWPLDTTGYAALMPYFEAAPHFEDLRLPTNLPCWENSLLLSSTSVWILGKRRQAMSTQGVNVVMLPLMIVILGPLVQVLLVVWITPLSFYHLRHIPEYVKGG